MVSPTDDQSLKQINSAVETRKNIPFRGVDCNGNLHCWSGLFVTHKLGWVGLTIYQYIHAQYKK